MDTCESVPRDRLKSHAALFDNMGQAAGLDLQEEAISGRLDFEEIAEAVLRCTRCAHPDTCQNWLREALTSLRGPAEIPDYCRNRDLLSYLCEPAG